MSWEVQRRPHPRPVSVFPQVSSSLWTISYARRTSESFQRGCKCSAHSPRSYRRRWGGRNLWALLCKGFGNTTPRFVLSCQFFSWPLDSRSHTHAITHSRDQSAWVVCLTCDIRCVFYVSCASFISLDATQFTEEVAGARELVRTSIEKKLKEEAKLAK